MSKHADQVRATIQSRDTHAFASSWERCASVYGLDPAILHPPEPDMAALRDALERDASLVEVASRYVDRLFESLEHADATVWLADRDGRVLAQRTGVSHDIWRRKPTRWIGARYQERDCGTSGVGTSLAEERPVAVVGDHHFFDRYVPLTGLGAPIFGPDGRLAGCLSCSYPTHESNQDRLALALVGSFVRRITIELFATAHPHAQLLLADGHGTTPCALLAVDGDDRVAGATRTARSLLALTDVRLEAGLSSRDLFDLPDRLADAEASLIAQSLVRHRHNRSAVARALGISRSTLYRKLARPPRGKS